MVDQEVIRPVGPAERLPPQNVEAEQSVLGSLLIDREAMITGAPYLQAQDFYRESHGAIFEAILDLANRHEPADFVTLCDELSRRGRLEEVGGAAYLTSLISAVPTAVHVEYYAHIVERCALLRRLIDAAGRITSLGYQDSSDVDATLDQAEHILFDISQKRLRQDFIPLDVALRAYFDQIDILHEHKGQLLGIPSGFNQLDQLLGGLHRSDLIIIAGRPSVGKTGFSLCIAHNVAVKERTPVAVFSLEMSVEQLVQRLLCMEARIDSQRLRAGYIDDEEWRKITQAFGVLSEAPMYIDPTANISVMELRTKARRLKSERDIGLIMVDYLQLMQGRGLENRVQEVSEISRSLKGLARELDVPVVAMSQLSRAVETRQDHRPILSDLRESGSIEQDADVVIFIHREEMYNPNTDRKDIADIMVAKHRNGPTGAVSVRFFPAQTRFADLASKSLRQHEA